MKNLILCGKARRIYKPDGSNDDINTDYIISGRYKFHIENLQELSKHLFEDIDLEFFKRFKRGDFVVAGRNFGCGSSREQAPLVLKHAGVSAVIAISFARIFYRNSFNIGLPVVECDTSGIEEGDVLKISLTEGIIENETKKKVLHIHPLPKFMINLLKDGGLVEHIKKYKMFKI